MSRVVTFVDTSVLVEVLAVPGKSQAARETRDELRRRTAAGQSLILPTATIIETGNHIAQVADGGMRRRAAEALSTLLERTIAGSAPWTLNGTPWDERLLAAICRGVGDAPSLVEMASQGVGVGDVSILAEADAYAQRVAHVDIRIWTLDGALSAWA